MYCAKCGFKLADNARFCSNCGVPVEASIPTDVNLPENIEVEPMDELILEEDNLTGSPQVEFDIVDHHICFDVNMIAYNAVRKQFSINASKHMAEFIKFYRSNVKSFDDLFGVAYTNFSYHIILSVEFGISVLMEYGVDYIDAGSLQDITMEYSDPDLIMAPVLKEAEKIQDRVDQINQSRNIERASRSRWSGGGFGLKGAIKGAITAGALNIATDAFRGIGDSLTDSSDRSEIDSMKKAVYSNPKTIKQLANGVYECCFGVFYGVCSALENENLIPTLSFDTAKQDARLNNYVSMYNSDKSIQPKLMDVLCDCIQYYPYDIRYYTTAYTVTESKRETILPVAQYFGLETEYLVGIAKIDESRLNEIRDMPEKTAADVKKKLDAIKSLNPNDANSDIKEITATLEKNFKALTVGTLELQKQTLIDDLLSNVVAIRKPIDDALSNQNLDFIWSEIDKYNVYAEYVIEQYYIYLCYSYFKSDSSRYERILENIRAEIIRYTSNGKLFGEYLRANFQFSLYESNDKLRAENHLKDIAKIASKGNISAMAKVGLYGLIERYGIIATKGEAVSCLEKAAAAQHPEALMRLRWMLQKGEYGISIDNEKVETLLKLVEAYGVLGDLSRGKAYEKLAKNFSKRVASLSNASNSISLSTTSRSSNSGTSIDLSSSLNSISQIGSAISSAISKSCFIASANKSEAEQIVETCFKKVSSLFHKNRVFVTKSIPSKKLSNAQGKYVIGIVSDEFPLLLFDSTVFGSGKDGCLLTNKALYFSRSFERPIRVLIEDIIGFGYIPSKGLAGEILAVKTKTIEYNDISTIYIPNDDVDKNTAGEAFSQLLNTILDS